MFLLATNGTASLVVAVSLIVLVGVLMLAAIIKYPANDVLRIWAGLGTLVGLITGSMATYFFTVRINEEEVSKLRAETSAVAAERETAIAQKNELNTSLVAAAERERQLKAESIQLATGKPTILLDASRGVWAPASYSLDAKERLDWSSFLHNIQTRLQEPDSKQKEGSNQKREKGGSADIPKSSPRNP